MPKRIDQVVYYCDNCGTCCVPEGTEVVDVTAISTTDFFAKDFSGPAEIDDNTWKYNAMNTFTVPYFDLRPSMSSRGTMDAITGGNVHVQKFFKTKDVYLCETCAEVFGPKYESLLTEMQDWATYAGLI